MVSGDIGLPSKPQVFTGEQLVFEERTSDPASTEVGEMWLRPDIAPETDQIGTLRFDNGSGTWDIPIFQTGTSSADVEEVLRIPVGGTVGYVPILADADNPAFRQLGFQHAGARYGLHNAVEVSAIPDSVVLRTGDNSSFTSPTEFGVRIRTSQQWPSIGAEISSQTSGATEARIYRVSDGTLLGSTSISLLSAGDTFTVDNVDLQANTEYNFVLWAEGSDWTTGFYNNPTYPYTSSDGNLEIINGAESAQSTNENPQALVRVGDVGF